MDVSLLRSPEAMLAMIVALRRSTGEREPERRVISEGKSMSDLLPPTV
jgi:hypothetical protein